MRISHGRTARIKARAQINQSYARGKKNWRKRAEAEGGSARAAVDASDLEHGVRGDSTGGRNCNICKY